MAFLKNPINPSNLNLDLNLDLISTSISITLFLTRVRKSNATLLLLSPFFSSIRFITRFSHLFSSSLAVPVTVAITTMFGFTFTLLSQHQYTQFIENQQNQQSHPQQPHLQTQLQPRPQHPLPTPSSHQDKNHQTSHSSQNQPQPQPPQSSTYPPPTQNLPSPFQPLLRTQLRPFPLLFTILLLLLLIHKNLHTLDPNLGRTRRRHGDPESAKVVWVGYGGLCCGFGGGGGCEMVDLWVEGGLEERRAGERRKEKGERRATSI
ncbi:hypothetical protein EYC80_006034 [Monilinia laxa]|uniref:Uncharacterized protein n=1 Tax=Monilinia laxa TaxID=61186 RepID=A0A5N6KFX3_MONLA|nr:hypothetical protein EYC80_006034 [Monilinia laxa]